MNQVLITGASSGIGRQLALDYAAAQWEVVACGQNRERLDGLALSSDKIAPLAFNVSDLDDVKNAVGTLASLPDLIILNAGSCEYIDNGNIDTALVKRVFDVNVYGLLHCIEAMQERFTARTRLVVVGSLAACPCPEPKPMARPKQRLPI